MIWARLPVTVRAILAGFTMAAVSANVWPLLLVALGARLAALAEIVFLFLFVCWSAGKWPPRSTSAGRSAAFRNVRIPRGQWLWGIIAALCLALTVHAAIVFLFRLVPFPAAAFRHGYDLSFVPGIGLKWLVVVMSAISAAVCEEIGFRGYMQQPIEKRHGAMAAIAISSVAFTALHLTKDWAAIGMVPIVLGAGVLLGILAWASQSLVFTMLEHVVMDTGLFAFWWTGIAGEFTGRPIGETGIDTAFVIACGTLLIALSVALLAFAKLRSIDKRYRLSIS